MKIPEKRNKIKGRSITCGHIWNIDIRYVLPRMPELHVFVYSIFWSMTLSTQVYFKSKPRIGSVEKENIKLKNELQIIEDSMVGKTYHGTSRVKKISYFFLIT